MPRAIHFEVQADDPERAARFYEEALGWQINKWEGPAEYWLVSTGPEDQPGINGAIMPRMDQGATVNTVAVPSVEVYVRRIEEAGGKAISPKQAIPGIGYHAYCSDSEGNVFGILESDEKAQ